MTREFFQKVLKARIYDTRKYRYAVFEYPEVNLMKIERLPVNMLGKYPYAWDKNNWQVMAVYA